MHKHSVSFRRPGISFARLGAVVVVMVVVWQLRNGDSTGQERLSATAPEVNAAAVSDTAFRELVQPLLTKYCLRCHNADNMESGIRVDQLTAVIEDRHIPLSKGIQKQIESGAMPPEDEPRSERAHV